MKILSQTLGVLALAVAFTEAAMAGPSNPTAAFGTPVAAKAARDCPMIKAETKPTTIDTPKGRIAARKVVGYLHPGCFMAEGGNVACKSSGGACGATGRS